MSNENQFEQAPPRCYQLLSAAEFASRVAGLSARARESSLSSGPLKVSTDLHGGVGYPAFQLEDRLDVETFVKLRQLHARSETSDLLVWDFLRTRHCDLGGATGVDFLLGYFDSEIATLAADARLGLFLELAHEEIWRVR